MKHFDESRYYRANDPALSIIGAPKTLANQRSSGRGPIFHKIGGRVLYKGEDLNAYLDAARRETAA